MKISLNIRPLIIIIIANKDDRPENGYWDDKGILNLDEVLKIIEEINWAGSAKKLKTMVIENEDLTIDKIMEVGFNLYNEETHAELYVGLLDDDFFDILLTTSKGEETNATEISGLKLNQIKEIVKLFYAEDFNRIRSYSNKITRSKSKIKELLTNRYIQQTIQERNNNFKQLGIDLALIIITIIINYLILYLIGKMI